jgi:hypothetical protein
MSLEQPTSLCVGNIAKVEMTLFMRKKNRLFFRITSRSLSRHMQQK